MAACRTTARIRETECIPSDDGHLLLYTARGLIAIVLAGTGLIWGLSEF